LIIAVFTLLYYWIFLSLDDYPHINSVGSISSEYYVSDLVKEFGPALAPEDWHLLEEKQKELIDRFNVLLAADTVLTDAGINNYAQWEEAYEKLFFQENLSEAEQKLRAKVHALLNHEGDAQRYITLIRYIDNLREAHPYRAPQPTISLLPNSIMYLFLTDMREIVLLLVICSLILLVPCQIHEKLCGVMPLYATTHTGRKIFGKQFGAELLTCGAVTALQLLIYLGIFISKGLTVYWKCPMWVEAGDTLLLKDVSFGGYMAVSMLLLLLFLLGSTVLAYGIGRFSTNYISGIAASIPAGGLMYLLGRSIMNAPFIVVHFALVQHEPFWDLKVCCAWLAAVTVLLLFILRRDRKRNL